MLHLLCVNVSMCSVLVLKKIIAIACAWGISICFFQLCILYYLKIILEGEELCRVDAVKRWVQSQQDNSLPIDYATLLDELDVIGSALLADEDVAAFIEKNGWKPCAYPGSFRKSFCIYCYTYTWEFCIHNFCVCMYLCIDIYIVSMYESKYFCSKTWLLCI